MSEPKHLTGGELNAEVTREVVRIHTASLGRGPRKSFTFHSGNMVITVLQDVMTRAERNLASNGDGEAVLAMRERFQRSMSDELKASLEKLTGQRVTALMSDSHLDPDMAVEVFILDEPLT